MGKWWLAFAFASALGCAPAATPNVEVGTAPKVESKLVAAYPTDATPAWRARVVCAFVDASPRRWSEVVVRADAKLAACELLVRSECDGKGDVVRACSTDPLPAPLVPRGAVLLRHAMPEVMRYEAFATADECASTKAERRPVDESAAWLEAQIIVETRDLDETKNALKAAERRLVDARSAQSPDVPLVQMEVETLRRKRDLAEKLLVGLRAQRENATTIACVPASGS